MTRPIHEVIDTQLKETFRLYPGGGAEAHLAAFHLGVVFQKRHPDYAARYLDAHDDAPEINVFVGMMADTLVELADAEAS